MRRTPAALAAAAVAAAASLAAGAPAGAHHAVGAGVDTGQRIVQHMVLTRVDWINPHAWFHFNVEMPNGSVVYARIEWLSVGGFRQAGYDSSSAFIVGDRFTVTYNPNRDGSPGGYVVKMVDDDTGRVFEISRIFS